MLSAMHLERGQATLPNLRISASFFSLLRTTFYLESKHEWL